MSDPGLVRVSDGRWELRGELNFSSVPALWLSLQELLPRGGELELSLAGVEQANSAGVVLLLEARDRARQLDCRLQLVDLPAGLLDLARMSGCESLLQQNPA